jgi:hypothetical protein
MRLLAKFIEHPASVGETYLEHMIHAAGFGGRLVVAGVACVLHSVVPFAFETTASREVVSLHGQMVSNRRSQHKDVQSAKPEHGANREGT